MLRCGVEARAQGAGVQHGHADLAYVEHGTVMALRNVLSVLTTVKEWITHHRDRHRKNQDQTYTKERNFTRWTEPASGHLEPTSHAHDTNENGGTTKARTRNNIHLLRK